MSGRRASRADGRSAGTAGGSGWATSSRPRVTGDGKPPGRTEIRFSCCAMRRSSSAIVAPRAEDQLLGLADVDERGDAALLAHLRQLQRLLARGERAPRDVQLQIERAQPEVGLRDLAHDVVATARRPHSLASSCARAASVARRYRPQKSSSHAAPTRRRRARPRCAPPPCRWRRCGRRRPARRRRRWDTVGAGDPELRLRLQHARGRDADVVVAGSAVRISACSSRPGTRRSTRRRPSDGRGWRRLGAADRRRRRQRRTLRSRARPGSRRARGDQRRECAAADCVRARDAAHGSLGSGAGASGARRGPRARGQALDLDVEHRDQEDGEQGRGQHAADHHRAQDAARRRAGAGRDPQRQTAEDEGERRHQDRPQPQRAPSSAAVTVSAPASRRALANSTIRIAFFAARPISITIPTWA